jgi:23S rRNA pseudouridine1911/1915/1917 synthase
MSTSLREDKKIPSQYFGQRVDVVLAQLFPEFSRSQLTSWLKSGAITIDQRLFRPKDKVCGGEHIELHIPLPSHANHPCEAENIPFGVIFEDEHLLVVHKPAGLIVHPGAGNPTHTLVNALLYHAPSLHHLPRAGIIHRLDKDTTGLLIVAKTLTTHTSLIRQMQAREIQRHYVALVYGHVISGGTLDTQYGRHPRHRLKMAVCPHGRRAITHYALRKQYQYFTLLDVTLMTGRTHQIRVHMAHMNHPIVGDPLYGGRVRIPAGMNHDLRERLKAFPRQALHASTLQFVHPETKESLTFNASLPDDFKLLLTTLESHIVPPTC